MVSLVLLAVVLGIFLAAAVASRMRNNRYRQEMDVVSSPLAEAISQMVGIAGGIYLSLIMLASFLGLNWPDKIFVCNMFIDPLALVAIFLACLQPIVLAILRRIFS